MNTASKGLLLSFVTITFWALNNALSRYFVVSWQVNPLIFTCLSLFVAAFVLILIAGPGRGGVDTLRQPHTWLYGIFEIFMTAGQMVLLLYITSTEMSFLNRLTVITALLAGWLFFRRPVSRHDGLGLVLIAGGLVAIVSNLGSDTRLLVLLLTVWIALFATARTMVAELHPESARALTIKGRCRVTGYVLLVSSFFFLLFMLAGALATSRAGASDLAPLFSALPTLNDFLHQPTMFSAMVLGAFVLSAEMYFYFYAARVAKTENFMIIAAFAPFMTYLAELGFSLFGLLEVSEISLGDLAAGAVITAGALVMLAGRTHIFKRPVKRPETV